MCLRKAGIWYDAFGRTSTPPSPTSCRQCGDSDSDRQKKFFQLLLSATSFFIETATNSHPLAPNSLKRDTAQGNGNLPSTLQDLDARGFRQSRFALPSQFKEHAQSIIETFFVVTIFPFLQGALSCLALPTKRPNSCPASVAFPAQRLL